MLQLLRGALRTPGLPSVGDALGSPSTTEGSEGDGPADLAKGHERATGKRDDRRTTEDTAATPWSKTEAKNSTALQLELGERIDSTAQADVDGHREQIKPSSGLEEGLQAQTTFGAKDRSSLSSLELGTSVEASSYPNSTPATRTSMIPEYRSYDRRPNTSQEKLPRMTAPSVEVDQRPHSAWPIIVQPHTNVPSLDEDKDVKCDNSMHAKD
ncbi:hypothetical protein LTR91_023377 [Friedmanniomyces endolithicus]|uniref:Uncharacterized protein n=1 Tax=Friedmanniomyces endolithicus TaxID=329885 RepID=A0AAN6H6E2_9PEZI|nr:hypothetical protein LTR59_012942 [Friedmanniomyces endolithicus]KAK0798097.1 hypothetical protein LTR75_009612 [Friedmanniomyces endolithicus]KAK0830055.1 hypothetical protein LTR03_016051 [Friedmanniomyces endolithicus]KAK0902393.1 hypothetical protein LTR57_019688 [Friedmanniomyces endolithicus]KAK0954313.1 hypothetical protein LTR91_023377 [Friedmanniomyces endolithicus]